MRLVPTHRARSAQAASVRLVWRRSAGKDRDAVPNVCHAATGVCIRSLAHQSKDPERMQFAKGRVPCPGAGGLITLGPEAMIPHQPCVAAEAPRGTSASWSKPSATMDSIWRGCRVALCLASTECTAGGTSVLGTSRISPPERIASKRQGSWRETQESRSYEWNQVACGTILGARSRRYDPNAQVPTQGFLRVPNKLGDPTHPFSDLQRDHMPALRSCHRDVG